MGRGLEYCCDKCGHKFQILVGVGFFFSEEFEKVNKAIKRGRYGKEWRRLMMSEELVVADTKGYFFRCGKCYRWETAMDLSLYKADDPEKKWNEQHGIKTAKEWGYIPYADPVNDDGWTLLKKRYHCCPQCKSEMERFDNTLDYAFHKVRYPSCGSIIEKGPVGFIMWD